MGTFKLPKGYSLTDPDDQTITVPDKGYGGADISQAFDAQGVHYVACCAWGPGEPTFRFRAFKAVSPSRYIEVPLPFVATGRGEIAVLLHDGGLWAIAWTGENFFYGKVEGFAPFPTVAERAATSSIYGIKSTVIAAPDDLLWSGNAMRIVQVLEYYGLIERGQ